MTRTILPIGRAVLLATLSCTLVITAAAAAHDPNAGTARACGTEHVGRITATIRAAGISCPKAHKVFRAVERTPLPNDVAQTPYFHYSPPYTVATPYGRFTCRFEPYGLAGSEHNVRCQRGSSIHVDWYTTHE
jgi:hypothetical protein